jgi:hypothetical protein
MPSPGHPGIDDMHLRRCRGPRAERLTPGGQAVDEEEVLEEADVYLDRPAFAGQSLSGVRQVQHLPGAPGKAATQQLAQHGALAYSDKFHGIAFQGQADVVVEPPVSGGSGTAQCQREPSGTEPVDIVLV